MMKKAIRLVLFDIDGVLTDGKVYINEKGYETKAYRLTEIDAINQMISEGYQVGAITGEDTPIVAVFEKRVSWSYFSKGCKDKAAEVKKICRDNGYSREEICYIGDGKYDISAIQYAGIGVCPQNAIPAAKEAADYVLNGSGGNDCINELYELLKEMKR